MPVGESIDKVLLAHVDRVWTAEREHAERYAARVRMIAPLCAAMLGLMLASVTRPEIAAKLAGLHGPYAEFVKYLFFLSVYVAASYLMRSTVRLLFSVQGATGVQWSALIIAYIVCVPLLIVDLPFLLLRWATGDLKSDRDATYASMRMDLQKREILKFRPGKDNPDAWPLDHWNVLVRVHNASVDLKSKNLQERRRLRTAEHDMARGVIILVIAIALYIFAII